MSDCGIVNTWFRDALPHINENLIKKEFITQYVYAERIPKGIWAANGSYEHYVDRLSAIKPPDCLDWRKLDGNQCETNACDFDADVIHTGNNRQPYNLFELNLKTDWVCLADLYQKQYPLREIEHLEKHMRVFDRYVRDEFDRTRWTDLAANKIVPIASDPEECLSCCADRIMDGWFFDRFEDGTVNPCYVFAAVDPQQLETIAELSNDMMDQDILLLQYENPSLGFDVGVPIYDLILPDLRVSRRLAYLQNESGDNFMSWGQFEIGQLDRAFGIKRVIGNYSHRIDQHALKYYPDSEYNDQLPPFNPDNPDTWPRFFRVVPYDNVAAQNGVAARPQQAYVQAPFAISNIFHPDVMTEEVAPDVVAYSSATKKDGLVTNTWTWKNPDWPCNLKRDKGFFAGVWKMAAQPREVELGYSYFHRVDTSWCSRQVRCPLPPEPPCKEDVTPYCAPGAEVYEPNGANLAQPQYD